MPKTDFELLGLLRRFFEICRKRRLVISLPKSDFFPTTVTWCGSLIDKDGITFNPQNLSGMRDASVPHTAAELCEYVHGVSCISTSIPRFAERVAPLRELLEDAYTKANRSRKKKSIAKFPVSTLVWGTEHDRAFAELQEQIEESTSLSHRDTNKF